MSQTPYYFKDASKNLDKLCQLLNDMEQYGLIHEELTESIHCTMSYVYPTENRKFMIADLGADANDPDLIEGYSTPVCELFELVKNKEMFIQDFRNNIALHLDAEQYPSDMKALVKEIKSMRDLELYRECIINEN